MSKYGDVERVKQDVETLNEIHGRQGSSLLIDVIAEHVGRCASQFSMNETERLRVLESLINELRESISERI